MGATFGMLPALLPTGDGSFRGRVVDSSGSAVEGAVITLRITSSELSAVPRRDGLYSFISLRSGVDYKVSASHEGLASAERVLRISNSGEHVGMDLVLVACIQFSPTLFNLLSSREPPCISINRRS